MAKSTGFQPPAWVKDPKLPNCGIRVRKGGKIIEEIESLQTKSCLTLGRHKGTFPFFIPIPLSFSCPYPCTKCKRISDCV